MRRSRDSTVGARLVPTWTRKDSPPDPRLPDVRLYTPAATFAESTSPMLDQGEAVLVISETTRFRSVQEPLTFAR